MGTIQNYGYFWCSFANFLKVDINTIYFSKYISINVVDFLQSTCVDHLQIVIILNMCCSFPFFQMHLDKIDYKKILQRHFKKIDHKKLRMYDWKFIQNRDQWEVDMITIHRFLSHQWLENSPLGQTFSINPSGLRPSGLIEKVCPRDEFSNHRFLRNLWFL